MATKGYQTTGIKSIAKVRSKKAPLKGDVFVEWDMLFKNSEAAKNKEKAIKELIDYIKSRVNPNAKDKTLSLQFQTFQCEGNELLYLFRVYNPPVNIAATKSTTTLQKKSSGSLRSLASSAGADEAEGFSNDTPAVAGEGPIRPTGPPPPPPPPGVQSVTNAVNLAEG